MQVYTCPPTKAGVAIPGASDAWGAAMSGLEMLPTASAAAAAIAAASRAAWSVLLGLPRFPCLL